jgi:serine/threonine-protein kinase
MVDASAARHAELSRKLEEACDFAGAARHALAAGDPRRAAHLAALGGDAALCDAAIDALASQAPREQALAAAVDLGARGFAKHAGALYERLGEHLDAANAFVSGGDAVRAAACFERAGRPADGARALEAAIRRTPERADHKLALGRLLARHGKLEAAARSLQQIPPEAPERAAALPELFRCLESLGLREAAREVREEMRERGVAEPSPEAAPTSAAGAPSAAGALADSRPVLFGRYELVREVAATPHAKLVEARDRLTGERVAVKTFASSDSGAGRDAWLRFEREARALMLLRHPHVVPLRAYLPESGAMVLAWMAGGSLADKLGTEAIAPARAAEIASAVLAALGEAHRLGILHRDVKPSNILFDEAGSPYLSDFGAAHLGDLSSTATAGAIGTFAYMSPEQRLGRPATLASDLYGVGAVLFELLTGEPPSAGAWGEGDDAQRDVLPSEHNPDLGRAHDACVRRLLEADPARRPADAFEARRELLAVAWPARLPPPPEGRPRAPSVRPAAKDVERLGPVVRPISGAPGATLAMLSRDTWMDRDVLVLPLDDAQLARARAFARAGHPALPAVLRADAAARQLWIAPALGEPMRTKALSLTRGQLRRLREAVAALHAVGGAHGQIDADHVHLVAGDVTLAYPLGDAQEGAQEADLAALAALERA